MSTSHTQATAVREAAPYPDHSDADLFDRYRRTQDVEIRNELVLRHQWIVQRCAASMSGRGVPRPDLVQVGQVGLIKAVERFDPDRATRFAAFARPTVLGEIRRHFRDKTWSVGVPRAAKERRSAVQTSTEQLHQELRRSPSVDEVADHCGLEPSAVQETQFANSVYRSTSLDRARDDVGDTIETHSVAASRTSDDAADAELHVEVVRALENLPERIRKILVWRFYEERTQREIGDRLGIGQVQVSRLLRAALGELEEHLAPYEPDDGVEESGASDDLSHTDRRTGVDAVVSAKSSRHTQLGTKEDTMEVRDLMTTDPVVCDATSSLKEAAAAMRDRHIGDVLVRESDGQLCGIVTDRDLVVRGLAAGDGLDSMTLADVCNTDLQTVQADAPVSEVVRLMEERAIRRAPVLEGDDLVGIVSIGDLAATLDAESALGAISRAAPDA